MTPESGIFRSKRAAFRLMRTLYCLATLAISALPAAAQNNYLYAVGNTNFGVNIPIEDGFINVANGEVHLEIPLAAQAQRGNLKLDERLVYDSRIWMIGHYSNYYFWPTNIPSSSDGWRFVDGNSGGSIGTALVSQTGVICTPDDIEINKYSFTWTDPSGVVHPFDSVWTQMIYPPGCAEQQPLIPTEESESSWANDASGYEILMAGMNNALPNIQILDRNGTQVYPTIADRFGNYWTKDSNGNLVDDLGRTPVETTTSGDQTTYSILTPGGGRANYVVTMETISVSTNFGQQGVHDWSGTLSTIKSIQLPDGTSYSFTYGTYGEMGSMTLPTGGTVVFVFSNYFDSYQNVNRWLTSYSGGHGSKTFSPAVVTQCSGPDDTGCVEKMTETDASGNDTVYTLTLNNGAWNTSVTAYQGNASGGTPLVTKATAYDFSQPCPSYLCSGAQYITKQTDTGTLDDAKLSTQTQYKFDPDTGAIDSLKEWYFYPSSDTPPASPPVDEEFSYNPGTAELTKEETFDVSGAEAALTTYGYSATPNSTTSGIVGHGAAPAGVVDPFLTSVGQWINTSGDTLTTSFTNDDTGSQTSSTDPNGETVYARDATDTFIATLTPPTPSSGVSLPQSAAYDPSTGLVTSRTDPNGETTTYQYDWAGRPTVINYPDGGKETFSYNANEVDETRAMTSSVDENRETTFDGYGRLIRVAVANGQGTNPWYLVDSCYGPNGRLSFRSYRYQGEPNGPEVCSGSGGDAYSYDALGRVTEVLHGDGTSVNYQYAGRAVKITDEYGNAKIIQRGALGRITGVCTISSEANMPGSGSPASCGLDVAGTGFLTTYLYSSFADHTTTVVQGGQSRVFQTDSLGRTVMVQDPESGTTTYGYGYAGTAGYGLTVTRQRPKANQTSAGVLTTTTTQYDSVGRIVSIDYNDGLTPNKTFDYDQADVWGSTTVSSGPSKGRLTAEETASNGLEAFLYGSMGRVAQTLECLPTWCGNSSRDKWSSYTYDLAGDMTSASDGAGVTATYTYSPAAEIQSITSSLNDATHPSALVSNVVNGPDGPISYQLGNGLGVYRAYDALGRVQGKWVCHGAPSEGCGGAANQVLGYWIDWLGLHVTYADEVETGSEQIYDYGYDQFGRLSTMTNHSTGAQVYNWVYDRYGNRWQQNPEQGGDSSQISFNTANNQINSAGYVYDAAGNLIQDPEHTYKYDAEGNLIEVDGGATATYTYDALNRRVEISEGGNQEGFVYNLAGQRTSSWNLSNGGEEQGEKYWGNFPVEFDWDVQANFVHANWLGTIDVVTNHAGATESDYTSLPYGDGTNATGNGYSPWQFAGLDKDYYANHDSGTNHAQFRQYGDEEGRWMSPDPYLGSYNLASPQSFNRYSYVMNDPLSAVDSPGLLPCVVGSGPIDLVCDLVFNGFAPGSAIPGSIVGSLSYFGAATSSVGLGALVPFLTNPWTAIGAGTVAAIISLGHLLGWWGQPAFHGSLRPRPSTPDSGFLHSAVCDVFSGLIDAAGPQNLDRTVGLGVGGSAGAGIVYGVAGSVSVQVVADRSGDVGLAVTVGGNPGFGVVGAGALGGGQASMSNAPTIYDLRGSSIDFGGTAGEGVAGGGDVAFGGGNTTGTASFGIGGGTKGVGLEIEHTFVPAALSTNCH